jgi:replicative DNA helicase
MTVTREPESVTPHSLAAEKSVLGSILVQADRILEVADLLQPAHFFRVEHQRLYAVMLEMARANQHIDCVTVSERLRASRRLDEIGGPAYLAALTDGMPRGFDLQAHARIIRDRAAKARLCAAANKILNEIDSSELDAAGLVDHAERLIFSVAEDDSQGDFVDAQQLLSEGTAAIETLHDRRSGVTGVGTGFPDFDLMTRGFQPGTLVLVAARPSMGKTSFVTNVAYHAATHGHTVGLFSLEMSRQELFMRMVSAVGRIDSHRLQSGLLHQAEYGRMTDAFVRIGDSNLYVDDSAVVGIFDVRGKARRLKARHGLSLLIIDYLQLMKLPKAENRNLAVAEVSRALKLVARELNVPVVALSQLSRETEKRGGDKRPLLSDLRDSGALEQDADLVVFIHRPEVYQETPTPETAGVAKIIIAKHRNGPTGEIKLQWCRESTRFENWTERT